MRVKRTRLLRSNKKSVNSFGYSWEKMTMCPYSNKISAHGELETSGK